MKPCSDPECKITASHAHSVVLNAYGKAVLCITYEAPPSDGKVLRDSETGEIIFEGRKDRVSLVPLAPSKEPSK